MSEFNNHYKIKFTGLKTGLHSFHYQLDNKFFESFDFSDPTDHTISNAEIEVEVELEKMNSMMVLLFDLGGWISSTCDRCMDPVQVELDYQEKLIVKFGDETGSTDDEVLMLGPSEFELDLRQYLYEYVHLSIPAKLVHENEKDCNQEIIDQLNYLPEEEDDENEIDPRWDQLKKLK